jgi:retron-type reverse transcriptase
VQQKLSVLLQDCVEEINDARGVTDRVTHGFTRDRSIVSNGKEHRNRRYVFNIDLADFFPSINFGRIRGFFIKDKNFALNEKVATVIAQIACHGKVLPQGSPCSPVISNLIAHVLDMHLVSLASSCGCMYSRYADDLTFSTSKKIFPGKIARPSSEDPHKWTPGSELHRLITHAGFQVNATKTRMQYRDSRQEVTGIVVNRRINVRYEYRHTARAMVHRLLNTGSFETYITTIKEGIPTFEKRPGTPNQLHGMLGFIDNIDLEHRACAQIKNPGHFSSNELMYQRFLIYMNFFAAQLPVILCEGETDNVYLTHAIRALAANYPQLATTDAGGKVSLKVRLYKYRKSSTARLLGLRDGGISPLCKLIATYNKETAKFNAPGQQNPVIILHDNDSAAPKIRSAVKEVSGKIVNGTEPFIRVVRNLYVVPTPLPSGALTSKIEDFFDAGIKATVIAGKTFDDKNNYETATHYGKKIFAYAVVRPNANSINFDGFHPLLANLASAIGAHAVPAPNVGSGRGTTP